MFKYRQQIAILCVLLSISVSYTYAHSVAYNTITKTDDSENTQKSKTIAIVLGSVFGAALFIVALIISVVLIWKRMFRTRNFPFQQQHRHTRLVSMFSVVLHPQITYRNFMVQRAEKQRRKQRFNEESHLFSGDACFSHAASNKHHHHHQHQHHMGSVSDWTQNSSAADVVDVDGGIHWGKQQKRPLNPLKPFGISIFDGTPKNQSSSSSNGSVVGSEGETATRTPMTMNETLIDEETAVGPVGGGGGGEGDASERCWYEYDEGGSMFDEDGVYQSFGVDESQDMMNTTFNTYLQDTSRFGDTFTPSFRV